MRLVILGDRKVMSQSFQVLVAIFIEPCGEVSVSSLKLLISIFIAQLLNDQSVICDMFQSTRNFVLEFFHYT